MLTESGPGGRPRRFAIVGVAADRATGFGPMKVPNDGSFVYRLMEPSLTGYLLVRFEGDASGLDRPAESVEGGDWLGSPGLDHPVEPGAAGAAQVREFERWMTAIGAIGLGLALIGVFGLLAFTAVQRRKEVAIGSPSVPGVRTSSARWCCQS